ncbi:UbiA family prenyltransferase [Dictyobacter aurantiacus]|uniref:1,4-dihydroxy-2-naphthoate octaprenyltransferase n=1 Tax=Dictyobacter aurantiacus TaxID=1936993 RepID=A0A401ZBN4_9CHLR|nr:UbiA family prenyltransferase [Dictyobacter aurantiacus]GCE04259.1 hypothetical protein KDAU_15880 [Dictyobacter aurantiacus]
METLKQRRPGDRALGFFLLCHPGPVLIHTVAVTVFAVLGAWPHLVWTTLLLVIGAHFAMQCSIAVLNDYCDRRLDIESKRQKPIARGLVSAREALVFGWAWIILMFLLLLPLNWLALLISLLYLLLGQGYNLGLKSTPWSGIVFALAIPLIPVYAFVGVAHGSPALFCLIPVAALLGIALNLSNSLPDIAEDATNNARTLAVVLGEQRTLLACPLLVLSATILVGLFTLLNIAEAQPLIIWPTLLLVCVLIVVLAIWPRFWRSEHNDKHYFLLTVFTCLLLASGWLSSLFIM